MSTLLEIALSNLLMAAALAVPAALAGWWGRRPALTHGLWLLVLLKLVTPPICRVPIALLELPEEALVGQASLPAEQWPVAMPAPHAPAEPIVQPAIVPPDPLPDAAPAALPDEAPVAGAPVGVDPDPNMVEPQLMTVEYSPAWSFVFGLIWLAGAALWLLLAVGRLARFHRLLRFAEPAAPAIQSEARFLAGAMGVSCPRVLQLPGTISPMLWAIGGTPRLLLPAGLLERLRPTQQATLIAHELAHWRRGDHRVRWLEVLTLGLYWWCPFVWWVLRQLHQAEEECCDAWVVALFPDAARDYALTLVETIDFLSGAPQTLPPVASGVGHVRLLKRRLTMILRGVTPQSLTRRGVLLLAGLGLVLLPFVPSVAQPPANFDANRQRAIDQLQALLTKNAEDSAVLAARLAEVAQAGQPQPAQSQADLEAKKAQLQQQLDRLQQAIRQLQQAAEAAAKQGSGPNAPMSGSAPLPKAVAGKGRGASGTPGGMGMLGMMSGIPGSTGKGGSVEQRLEQVERKLDILLWEIANLRRDMGKGHPAPGHVGPSPGTPGFPRFGNAPAAPGSRPGGAPPGGLSTPPPTPSGPGGSKAFGTPPVPAQGLPVPAAPNVPGTSPMPAGPNVIGAPPVPASAPSALEVPLGR